jgi:sulfide dehydrogenase [flavocytochrome c] flavoprotein chain
MPVTTRRDFFCKLSALGILPFTPIATATEGKPAARIVIIGGGFGGATCAKYLRRLAPTLEVTLVETHPQHFTCPMSNAVLAGLRSLATLTVDYTQLNKIHGVKIVQDTALGIDPVTRKVGLKSGTVLNYDRLVVSPGIDFHWGSPEGYDETASLLMPHAWKAGPQTELLRAQLEAMPDGGVVAIAVPTAPFRCPPGPYERASLIAHYLKQHKSKSKLMIFDGNDKFSKQPLFLEAWKARYANLIEWIPLSEDGKIVRIGLKAMTLHSELESHKVSVANVIPAQSAGKIAITSGLTDSSGWCPIHPRTFESTKVPNIHVIGDACIAGPMPKSASSANSQAKNCALALVALLNGKEPTEPALHNTCYSLAGPDYGISINAIYRLQAGAITPVEGAGGISPIAATAAVRQMEAGYTLGWYDNIVADSFGTRTSSR